MTVAEIIKIVDAIVAIAGFLTWALFLPQIRLLLDKKRSDSISLGMTWGSWVLQLLILIQSILKENWTLTFTVGVSVLFLSITNVLIHYYRAYPGGR